MSTFGAEVDAIWPPVESAPPPLSPFGRRLLEQCKSVEQPDPQATVDVRAFMRKSTQFPLEFGVETCRVQSQPRDRHELIGKQIASVYPLIHERTLALYLAYLEHKGQWGNAVELRVYRQLSLVDFVQRLLSKRCASFFARNDKFLLVTGERGASGFEPIGSLKEQAPLQLEHVLSYDDIKLSALLSVSSHTEFINEGERTNCGRVTHNRKSLETDGVIVGMIGARLSRRNLMEFQDIVIARTQNTPENGYGHDVDAPANSRAEDYRRIWRGFYETRDFLRNDVDIDGKRFGVSGNKQDVFDNLVMKRRYAISFDMLLLEAEARAASAGKQAYIHVVGFGLGVWKVAPQQEQIFLETFEQRLRVLSARLTHIGVVHFSWFKLERCGGIHNGAIIESSHHPDGGVRVHLSKRNPAQKLTMLEHANMLLVVSYAWDGNALPGNEFWMKMLKSTGDSSTACSTLIAELHNPHINDDYCNGRNLHIASPKYGVLHISEYAKRVLETKSA
ncbi:uncharacterized protein LOC6583855 [Drosophila mojavensis]|uniref:Uncharacterized protein n=1 Tax=Drosophila mojavensis TaxID=7230 RepID=B4L2F8_DROMO|nr:uncharacterized protein LOC6583855 [Drosophila mojavensis]EDW06834.1 uncharacterized protein Dmoj_GI15192 [Drosophila mojavensis]